MTQSASFTVTAARRTSDGLFDRRRLPRSEPLLCFCMPYAGGGANSYMNLDRHLAGRIGVVPLCLPGRGMQFREAPYTVFAELLDDLHAAIAPLIDRDFALFGHSLGALIAYAIACRLHEHDGLRPRHLFVSGTRAPHASVPASSALGSDFRTIPDQEFARRLSRLGGFPAELLREPELIELAMPAVRADFQLFDSFSTAHTGRTRVACNITAFGGMSDFGNVPEASLRAWREYTEARFDMRLFPGGHFFINEHADAIAQLILQGVEPADGR